jgi:hypothetical protein
MDRRGRVAVAAPDTRRVRVQLSGLYRPSHPSTALPRRTGALVVMTSERLERSDVLGRASRIHLGLHDQRHGDTAAGGEQAQHDEKDFDCHGRVPLSRSDDVNQCGPFDARSPVELAQAAGG